MITIEDFMKCIEYKVTGGDEYDWGSYGPNARIMDYWNGRHDSGGVSISIIFDTQTHTVYQMEAWDYKNSREYRWLNPDFKDAVEAEAKNREVDFNESIDFRKFIDLDVEEDMLEKATAIYSNKEYDNRIMVTLDLDDESKTLLMTLAHEADMTLNKYVEHILQSEIGNLENDKS